MQQELDEPHPTGERLLLRSAAIVGLGGVALIHVLNLQEMLQEAPYLGILYFGPIVGGLWLAGMLIRRDSSLAWIAGGALSLMVIIGYVLTRTTGLPNASGDIGNWSMPLGLASLFVEGWTVLVAIWAMWIAPKQPA